MPIENLWASLNFALIGLIVGVLFLFVWMNTSNSKKDTKKIFGWISIIGLVVAILGAFFVPSLTTPLTGNANAAVVSVAGGAGSGAGSVVSTYQPTATYATQNAFSTATVSGTSYYQEGNNPASSTAISNVEKGKTYTYWVDNATGTASSNLFFVKPLTFVAGQVNTEVNKLAYNNGSYTITGYDLIGSQALFDWSTKSGGTNVSMGANDNAKVKLTYSGSAKYANLPFGGLMVVEYNNTIASLGCSGDGIVGPNTGKYQITYSPAQTYNTFKVFEVAEGFDISPDNGNTGALKVINCDFTNGATAATGTAGKGEWYVNFYPANYYIANDGKIYLDVEKAKNGATTRTGVSPTPNQTFAWTT